ncbi:MAG: hypothetical protein Q4A28_01135 [Brachymonas sp.]|nr:hypothetical protein [Brachymonas sp.]
MSEVHSPCDMCKMIDKICNAAERLLPFSSTHEETSSRFSDEAEKPQQPDGGPLRRFRAEGHLQRERALFRFSESVQNLNGEAIGQRAGRAARRTSLYVAQCVAVRHPQNG